MSRRAFVTDDDRRGRNRGITLIELLAVVTLLSLAVGALTVGMDGFTEEGRLRAAANQIVTLHQTARLEAVSGGSPRQLVFEQDGRTIRIERPDVIGRRWQWVLDREAQLSAQVTLGRVTIANSDDTEYREVRIHADGTSPKYMVELKTGKMRAFVTIDGINGQIDAFVVDGVQPKLMEAG